MHEATDQVFSSEVLFGEVLRPVIGAYAIECDFGEYRYEPEKKQWRFWRYSDDADEKAIGYA